MRRLWPLVTLWLSGMGFSALGLAGVHPVFNLGVVVGIMLAAGLIGLAR